MINVALIIPAAGIGKRFSENIKKQFYEFDSKPVIYWTIKRLFTAYKFDELVIGLNDEDINYMENIIEDLQINVPVVYASGGKERMNTVLNCIEKSSCSYVAVHDSIRPFVSDETVKNVIEKAISTNAAICGIPVRDTMKKCNNGKILSTVPRDNMYLAHTPQVFKKDIIYNALRKAIDDKVLVTDEASACEYMGIPVDIVLSNYENVKVTYAEDIDLINLFKNKFFGVK